MPGHHTSRRPWTRTVTYLALFCVALWLAAATPPLAAQEFIRGDCDGNGLVSIEDAFLSLEYQFIGVDSAPTCLDAFDANDDGKVRLSDPIFTFSLIFLQGAAPPAPFPDCGLDPTSDNLGCDRSAACSLGGPLSGLLEEELLAFNRGRVLMEKKFTPEEGLGPFFNTTSCEACHSTPTVGGSAPIYRNFFLVGLGFPGAQIPIQSPLLPSLVLPAYGSIDGARPSIPGPGPLQVTAAQRNAPPMFGTGLFELISNQTIMDNADPNDTISPDGISGRYNTDGFGNIGRFGFKSQANNIEAFIRGAANNQMGMTTDPVLGSGAVVNIGPRWLLQVGAGLDTPTTDNDTIPDPEISTSDFADIVAFNLFLAPPRRGELTAAGELGELRFTELGCVLCHIPELPSAAGPVAAYTDLLLHDMGPDLADGISMGIPQPSALAPQLTDNEFRTQPLWGVSKTAPYLHDGRADTLFDAISMHGGEAASIRDAFLALPPVEQEAILEFLRSL